LTDILVRSSIAVAAVIMFAISLVFAARALVFASGQNPSQNIQTQHRDGDE
jgi:hypothetical protein